MKNKILKNIFCLLTIALVLVACSTKNKTVTTTTKVLQKAINKDTVATTKPQISKIELPEVKREFRAAWVATVANINWPSSPNLSSEQQKQEAIYLLNTLEENNFNAVVLQVRPSADALYKSSYEPWSSFLTGETGRTPYPYYDPLEFWIEEAHKRGLELHVWLNPYRAHHTNGGAINGESMVKKMPDEIVKLRNGMYWFDPSNQKVQDHVSNVILDLVKRYDIDGVHIDDYFYPYKEYNGGRDFPDDKSWKTYINSGGTLSRADWRRGNVNKFVERIYREIKTEKKYVLFGISPFGIWKSGYPSDVTGTSQYDELYADAKLWLNQGWMDYFSPQLYWKINSPGQNFNSLLQWWKYENTKGRHLWPGLNTVGVKDVEDRPTEILNEIKSIREILPKDIGEIHYSIAGLTNDYRMLPLLKESVYKDKVLVPASSWLQEGNLEEPTLSTTISGNTVRASWSSPQNQNIRHWILYAKYGNNWEVEILNYNETTKVLNLKKNNMDLKLIAVKAVDRIGIESPEEVKIIK